MAHTKHFLVGFAIGSFAPMLLAVSGCAGVSDATKEQVAKTEAVVQQAESTSGEAGALELQRAKDKLASSQHAVKDGDETRAKRLSSEAELDAELAVAKTQESTARKAVDELSASIDTLRREANRNVTDSNGTSGSETAPTPSETSPQ